MLQSLSSELVIDYIDDITFGGPEDIVTNDVTTLKDKGISFGVHLNTGKCESITKTASASVALLTDFIPLDVRNSSLLRASLSLGSAIVMVCLIMIILMIIIMMMMVKMMIMMMMMTMIMIIIIIIIGQSILDLV